MHRCQCSTRTLQAFVRDIAGLGIRQQRAQVFYQRQRGFSTRPPGSQVGLNDAMEEQALSERAVDAISLHGLHPSPQSDLGLAAVPLLPQQSPATVQKSRAESRKERKLRRIEAGKYRVQARSAKPSELEEVVGEQVETVLKKIELMEGPSIKTARKAPSKEKQRVDEEKAGKGAEKQAPEKAGRLAPKPKKEPWQIQKAALEEKYGAAGWQPRKRLSPDTLDGIRTLHASDPVAYSTAILSEHFKVSPDAIRRILKSKWRPSDEETEDRRKRWEKRGVRKWSEMAEQGVRPPKKWREMGVGSVAGHPEEKPAWKTGGKRHDHYVPFELAG